MRVRDIFFQCYPQILVILKRRLWGYFRTKKSGPNRGSSLNSSIDKRIEEVGKWESDPIL